VGLGDVEGGGRDIIGFMSCLILNYSTKPRKSAIMQIWFSRACFGDWQTQYVNT
jgi:hypothetical protein